MRYLIWLVVLGCCAVAHAARVDPPPLVESLRAGYGVVSVTLVEQKPTGEQGQLSLHLRVEKLIAAPASGRALPVKDGQIITVPTSIGYGGQIEQFPQQNLKPGQKFLMVLHVNETSGDLEGLPYAGAVRVVENFDPAELQAIARIGELAAAKPPQDSALARQLLGEEAIPAELRWNAHAVLRGAVDPAARQANAQFLHGQWRAISIAQPYEALAVLDRSLCDLDPAFAASDERLNGWFGVIFAPFAAKGDPRSSDAVNSHLIPSRLDELGKQHPNEVAARVIHELHAKQWPLYFRWRLAGALQGLYQRADVEHNDWQAELQRFFAAAFAEAGSWELRLLPSSIAYGMEEPKYDRKRRFVADPAVWNAMAAALGRMETLARQEPSHPDARSAVVSLREALKLRPQ